MKRENILLYLVFLISFLVLLGWNTNIEIISQFTTQILPMASITAFLFILNGLYIFLYKKVKKNTYLNIILNIIPWIVLVIASIELFGWFYPTKIQYEKYLITNSLDFLTIHQAIVNPVTSGLFIVLSISLILFPFKKNRFISKTIGVLAGFSFLVSLIILVGYIQNFNSVNNLNYISAYTTAFCFLLVSIIILSRINFQIFPFHYLVGQHVQARLIRNFIPFFILFFLVHESIEKYFYLLNDIFLGESILLTIALFILIFFVGLISTWVGKETNNLNLLLKESETKFRELFEKSGDAIIIIKNNTIVDFNQATVELFGYQSIEQMIGVDIKTISADFQPNGQSFSEKLKEVINLTVINGTHRFEWMHKKQSGEEFLSEVLLTLIKNEPNNRIIHSVIRDITSFKKTEQELRKAQSIAHIGSWHLDLATNNVIWTEELYKMYGFNPKLPVPPYTEHMKLFTPESWDILSTSLAKTSETGEPYELELRTIKKNGSNGWMWVRGEVVKDSKGKIIGLWGAAQDITTRKNLELDLIKAKEKAEESDRLKSAFLANMSHEIRTPMNSILGFSELLLNEKINSEKKEKYHEIVNNSGKRLMNLISDIVDISKIDAQQLKLINTVFNLNKQLDILQSQFNISSIKKNVTIKTVKGVSDEKSFINCDNTRLVQVISNLIENALKFTQEGMIEFGYQVKETDIQFFVKDTGVGIKKKDLKIIFERFRQSENHYQNKIQGTGLGLSICKGIVETFGGKIWVESDLNKGATFYFTIPKCFVENSEQFIDKKPEVIIFKNEEATILIAEDEESNYLYLKAALEKYNFKLLHALNGKEVIELVKTNNIDLILMDINMPIMNGIETTKIIRKTNKELPIIALTAYAMSQDKENALKAGCNDFVTKPINRNLLIESINNYLEISSLN